MTKIRAKWIAPLATLALLAGCNKPDGANNTVEPKSGTENSKPATQDWTATVVRTEEAGYRMGNPDAAVKLVEYGALTCPHCGRFAVESSEGLKQLVAKGNVSFELRTFVVHPGNDEIPSMLAKCNGPAPFFPVVERLFATQQEWIPKYQTITPEDQRKWSALPQNEALYEVAGKLGLVKMVAEMGIPADKVKACFADPKGMADLTAINLLATTKYQVNSTPTFIINGQVVEGIDGWPTLKAKLIAAGG